MLSLIQCTRCFIVLGHSIDVSLHFQIVSLAIDVILVAILERDFADVRSVDLLVRLRSVQLGEGGPIEIGHLNGCPLLFIAGNLHRHFGTVKLFVGNELGEEANVGTTANTKRFQVTKGILQIIILILYEIGCWKMKKER